jgi:CBS domain-containing protein
MRVRDILRRKGERVISIAPDRTVLDGMKLLVEEGIGSLVVLDGDRLVGIITERDVLRHGAAGPDRLAALTVAEAMTRDPVTGRVDDDLRSVMDLMTQRRFRHLPILDGDRLAGMVSIGDVVLATLDATRSENEQLRAYISGTP